MMKNCNWINMDRNTIRGPICVHNCISKEDWVVWNIWSPQVEQPCRESIWDEWHSSYPCSWKLPVHSFSASHNSCKWLTCNFIQGSNRHHLNITVSHLTLYSLHFVLPIFPCGKAAKLCELPVKKSNKATGSGRSHFAKKVRIGVVASVKELGIRLAHPTICT